MTLLAHRDARHRITGEVAKHPPRPSALLFDDPDWHSTWDLADARTLADRGLTVIAALPRHRLLAGPSHRADLDPAAEVADLVVEVRHTNLVAAGAHPRDDHAGYAALAVLRNRRGPVGTVLLGFEGHYARFVDIIRP